MSLSQNPYIRENASVSKHDASVSANRILVPAFLFYTLLVLTAAFHHEPWADEAQAWLLVRDNSFVNLLKVLPSEGHPPLWYLVIMPFVKLNLPYESIKYLSALLSVIAVFLLQFKTRLPLYLKLMVPFSCIYLYEYAVFARSYSLVLLFVALFINLYPDRFNKPWLFAACVISLFNTHVLMFGFCTGIVLLYAADCYQQKKINKQTAICLVLMFIGGFYLLPYLGTHEMVDFFRMRTDNNSERFFQVIRNVVYPGSILLSVALLVAFIMTSISARQSLVLLFAGLGGLLYILTFCYTGNEKHAGLLFVILLASCGITQANTKNEKRIKLMRIEPFHILALITFLQIPQTSIRYLDDLHGQYSASKETAGYITKNNLANNTIVAYWSGSASAILPYLPAHVKFYQAERQKYGTYQVYDSSYRNDVWMNPVDYAVKIGHDDFSHQLDRVLFLFNYPVQPATIKYLNLVYKSSPAIRWDETFYIYRFKENVQ